jgi:dolichyl-phosphate beta-glucosyltransferase
VRTDRGDTVSGATSATGVGVAASARRPRCAIVVPCYNEERRLQPQRFLDYVSHAPDVEFLMVNDGSADRTADVLSALERTSGGRIRAITLAKNQGKAEAVRQGLALALAGEPDVVGFWDADLATPLEAIDELREELRRHAQVEMVFGSRVKLLGRTIERQPMRHYAGRIFATLTSIALRLPVYDTQCGAKLFRRTPQIASYFSEPFSTRWIFDVEILARALVQPGRRATLVTGGILEYPLHEWRDIKGSKLKAFDFVIAAGELVRIWAKYRP